MKRETVVTQKEYLEWLEFFENAGDKKESDMAAIETPHVREAYARLKMATLPLKVKDKYYQEASKRFEDYAEYTEHLVRVGRSEGEAKGEARGRIEIAKNLMTMGCDDHTIQAATDLPWTTIAELRSGITSLIMSDKGEESHSQGIIIHYPDHHHSQSASLGD